MISAYKLENNKLNDDFQMQLSFPIFSVGSQLKFLKPLTTQLNKKPTGGVNNDQGAEDGTAPNAQSAQQSNINTASQSADNG